MARVVKVANFHPLVLRNIICLALFGGFIGILGADGIDVILRLVVKFPVEVGKLMARARVLHWRPRHDFVGLLIHNECLSAVDALDVVLSLLSANDEDLVLGLDRREVSRQFVCVSQLDALCRLAC